MHNKRHEAEKLLAHLGWSFTIPMLPATNTAPAWSTQVPIVSTVPKRELATDKQLEDADLWGDNLDALDDGTLRITQPQISDFWKANTHPMEWALWQVEKLDDCYEIDYSGELPVIPEAEKIGQLWFTVQDVTEAQGKRNPLVLMAKDVGVPTKEIAEVLGVSVQAIYALVRRLDLGTLPTVSVVDSPLEDLKRVVDYVKEGLDLRDKLIVELKEMGLAENVIARIARLSQQNVNLIAKQSKTGVSDRKCVRIPE